MKKKKYDIPEGAQELWHYMHSYPLLTLSTSLPGHTICGVLVSNQREALKGTWGMLVSVLNFIDKNPEED